MDSRSVSGKKYGGIYGTDRAIKQNAVNEDLRRLHQTVEAVKQNREVELDYMKYFEQVKEYREEGREEGRAEERRNTERERQRAEAAEQRADRLEEEIRMLKEKYHAVFQ